MSNINNEALVNEIKGRLSIINLVESYTSVKKKGRGYVALCPFHDDKNPSMHLDDDKGLYHCFSCGAGGDMFGFYMRYNSLSFPEALSELAKKAGVAIPEHTHSVINKSPNSVLYKINAVAAKYYRRVLRESPMGEGGRKYLKDRDLPPETASEFILGFAPEGWDSLVKYLSQNNIPMNIAEKVGLIVKRKNTEGYYDRFRKRIIFPICNVEGKVIGFGGRRINEEDEPKYLNSPESDIYHKRKSFYGINKSKDYIRREDRVILVEGYTDFLSLYSAGIKNVVATLGTSLTREHVSLLRRYTDNVLVVFDNDESGIKAADKSLDVFLQEGVLPYVLTLEGCMDPDSFIRKEGLDRFKERIENSIRGVEFRINTARDQMRKGMITRKQMLDLVVGLIENIKDSVERSFWIKETAQMLSIQESQIYSRIRKKIGQTPTQTFKSEPKYSSSERLLFTALVKFPNLRVHLNNDWRELVSDNRILSVLSVIIEEGVSDPSVLLHHFENESLNEMISESLLSSPNVSDEETAAKIIKACLAKLKFSKLDEMLKVLRLEIDQAIKDKDDKLEKKLLKQYQELSKQKQREEGAAS